jgi:hypothetical protein
MTKPYVHSYTGIKEFEQCPRRFQATKILKLYPYEETEATRYGNEVHKAIEEHLKYETPIPEKHAQFTPVVQALASKPGRVEAELKFGVRRDLSPCGFFDRDVWLRGAADIVVLDDEGLKAWVGDWKGLPLDTPLPTPKGWTTMAEVRLGDALFSESGELCTVVGKSGIKNLRCFEIEFDDTSRVTCDEEHLWKLADGSVRPVTALRKKDLIAVPGALALPDEDLPIDPYVLGLWLADGKHTSGEISKPDAFVWEEIQRRGYEVDMSTGGKQACPTRTVKKLRGALRKTGLLGNKYIPPQYLRAGYVQRLDLLRGLMDGDGSANPTRKQAIFTTTDKALSDAVHELLITLGQRPLQSTTRQFGFGVHVTAFPLSFRPVGLNPFLLPRKRDRILPAWGAGNSTARRIVAVREVAPVPTQCIAVDSSDRTYLCTRKMIPTHNTGKNKYPDLDQMTFMSLFVFAHYAHIRQVNSGLIFLLYNDLKKQTMTREDAPLAWSKVQQRAARVEAAIEAKQFPPKPGPLCGWCPHAKGCEHHPRH